MKQSFADDLLVQLEKNFRDLINNNIVTIKATSDDDDTTITINDTIFEMFINTTLSEEKIYDDIQVLLSYKGFDAAEIYIASSALHSEAECNDDILKIANHVFKHEVKVYEEIDLFRYKSYFYIIGDDTTYMNKLKKKVFKAEPVLVFPLQN